eukprot:GFUD01114816.1.p1 GENE.GFUD01114816.1~~GFUD01114816.1.p1  ORF type:complete len:379 (-),score=147.71 GFUD01114816.1:68-1204(-)
MGNIMSFFFPEPAPASIEQVVEKITEDVATKKVATEDPVDPVPEDLGMVGHAKPEDLMVEQDCEVVKEISDKVSAEQTNEDFEFVEEDKLENVSNVLNDGKDDVQEESISKLASQEATEVDIISSVKDSDEKAQKAAHPEPIRDEASEPVDNSVNQENANIIEVEMIGSIQESNVELVEETTSKSVDLPTSEPIEHTAPGDTPIKDSTPEPLKDFTPEASSAPEPAIALTPEAIRVSTPAPPKATTPVPTIQDSTSSAPEHVEALTPEAIIDSTPEPVESIIQVSISEPNNIPTPEQTANVPVPMEEELTSKMNNESAIELTKEPSSDTTFVVKDVSLEVDVIGLIEENNVKNDEEELSGGASGLKDLLTGSNDLNEE